VSLSDAREILRATRLALSSAPLEGSLSEAGEGYSVEAVTMARGYLVRAIIARGVARQRNASGLVAQASTDLDRATQRVLLDEALVLMDPPPSTEGAQLVREIAAMLRALREVMHLEPAHPRRVAVLAEKKRILAAIEACELATATTER